jgi:hypothetical protein
MLTMHNEMTKARPDAGPVITIVAPALDEAVNLPVFAERIRRALQSMDMDWELIIVDDGSSDDSQRVLNDLHETDPRIGFVSLSRSFGQQMAILAGLDVARGGAAIVMDADLQQPPELTGTHPALAARRQDRSHGPQDAGRPLEPQEYREPGLLRCDTSPDLSAHCGGRGRVLPG